MSDYYSFTTEYGRADELFQAVLSLDKPRVERLKASGVTLTENVKQTLVNGGGSMMSNKPAAPFWYLYLTDLESVEKADFAWISRTLFAETGAPLYFSDSLEHVIAKYFFNKEVFTCLPECYDLKKLNKTRTMKELVRKNNIELLGLCVKHGWLKQAKKRDEMITYANEQNRPECTAWLLEFKNNIADLKAERAKAEKKAEREFNAAPDSALELGKLWSRKKGEDGGLIITSYKGYENSDANSQVTVPYKIGSNIVTAIADYALSPIAPKLKEPYTSRRVCIKKITVSSGIRTVGECAFGGSGTNSQWRSATSLLEEVVLPDTLDIFADRKAAETAPKMFDHYGGAVAVVPECENAVFYCIKNNIRYRFAGSDEVHIPKNEAIKADALLSAILACDREMTAELKKDGAAFSEHIKNCLANAQDKEAIWRHGILSDVRDEFTERVIAAEDGDRRFILNAVREELGAPLQYDDHIRYMLEKVITPELFDCILEYYDTKRLNRAEKMQSFIINDKLDYLAVCAKHGWLKNAATRDKMIQFATDGKKTEASAWLLDYKNRTTDPEAEKKRAEKKRERELNADPFSPKEMRKLWKFTKLEDGTLEITCYKGAATDVVVPEKIGEDIVTSIGKGAFTGFYNYSPNKSKDKDFCEHHKNIVSVTLPDTVKSIGAFAFGFCDSLREIVIPGSVKLIGANAFVDGALRINPSITVTVEKDSFAERFCKKYNFKFKYKDEV